MRLKYHFLVFKKQILVITIKNTVRLAMDLEEGHARPHAESRARWHGNQSIDAPRDHLAIIR